MDTIFLKKCVPLMTKKKPGGGGGGYFLRTVYILLKTFHNALSGRRRLAGVSGPLLNVDVSESKVGASDRQTDRCFVTNQGKNNSINFFELRTS